MYPVYLPSLVVYFPELIFGFKMSLAFGLMEVCTSGSPHNSTFFSFFLCHITEWFSLRVISNSLMEKYILLSPERCRILGCLQG